MREWNFVRPFLALRSILLIQQYFLLFPGTGQEFLLPQAGMPDLGNTQNRSAIQTAIDIIKDESIIKVHFQICKMLRASIAEFQVFFNSTLE